jgi:membrane protease YdiL (CAAX protease family)
VLIRFFLLTYAVTWMLFGAAAWVADRLGPGASPGLVQQLFLPGAFGPALVAIWLTARAERRPGLRVLLQPVLQADVPWRWYLFAITYMAAIKLAVAVAHRVALGGWPRLGGESVGVIAVAIVFSTPFQAGEEIGWRGFALPRMATGMGLRWASVLLGVVWATWHLPLFFIPVTDTHHQSFPLYLLQVTALSVAAAWLWERSGRSLLLVMLMHAAVNQTVGMVPSAGIGGANPFTARPTPVGLLTVALLWVCAAYFLARMPGREPRPADFAGAGPASARYPVQIR